MDNLHLEVEALSINCVLTWVLKDEFIAIPLLASAEELVSQLRVEAIVPVEVVDQYLNRVDLAVELNYGLC